MLNIYEFLGYMKFKLCVQMSVKVVVVILDVMIIDSVHISHHTSLNEVVVYTISPGHSGHVICTDSHTASSLLFGVGHRATQSRREGVICTISVLYDSFAPKGRNFRPRYNRDTGTVLVGSSWAI